MPIRCTFLLNDKTTSQLYCSGYGSVEAYSGTKQGRDNPRDTAIPNIGPLPVGTYFLVDRESGGMFGWAKDWFSAHGWEQPTVRSGSCFGTQMAVTRR